MANKRFKPVVILPLLLLGFIPVMVVSWTFFYSRQKDTLAAASDPDTDPQTLEKLARKGNLDVKLRVGLNPSTPEAAIERIAREPTLRYYLIFEDEAPAEVVRAVAMDAESKGPMLLAAAGHPHATVDVLDALSGHPDKRVRAAVARNPKVPQEILDRLAGDEKPMVRDAAKEMLSRRRPEPQSPDEQREKT